MKNRLLLNDDKTHQVICTLSQSKLEEEVTAKLRGFVDDIKLSWEAYIIGEACKRFDKKVDS